MGLNAQPGVTVTLRVDAGPPPARLQHIAEQAAQSGDLRSMHAPGGPCVPRQRPVKRVEGVGSRGLSTEGRGEEERGEHRGLGGATAAPGRTPCVLKGRQRALFRIGGI